MEHLKMETDTKVPTYLWRCINRHEFIMPEHFSFLYLSFTDTKGDNIRYEI